MMNVTLTQHPVGQGGMMSGLLQVQEEQFHWVYDCGSNQTDALNRELEVIIARGGVDYLFLSHLDSDHVSGVDRLLARTTVKEVVLPYLDATDRIIAVAHAVSTGSLTGNFLTFMSDPEAWFGARGIDQITYITSRNDDDPADIPGPDMPERGEGPQQGEIIPKWSRLPIQEQTNTSKNSVPGRRSISQRVEFGASLCLKMAASYQVLNWILAPYAHHPSDEAIKTFKKLLQKTFKGSQDNPDFLVSALSDSELREQLRNCYDQVWPNHNQVSMALYAGPIDSVAWDGRCRTQRGLQYFWHHHKENAVGWLGTGDMHLHISRRRNAFITYYKQLLKHVNVFGLPHHGSYRNFHVSLLGALPKARQCVAAAGPNGYGHPSPAVMDAVETRGKDFIHVSSEGSSVLTWRHRS